MFAKNLLGIYQRSDKRSQSHRSCTVLLKLGLVTGARHSQYGQEISAEPESLFLLTIRSVQALSTSLCDFQVF